jgi:hypothetical protein
MNTNPCPDCGAQESFHRWSDGTNWGRYTCEQVAEHRHELTERAARVYQLQLQRRFPDYIWVRVRDKA